jgi:hypothetical protein
MLLLRRRVEPADATGASGHQQKQSDQVQKSITEAENLP